MNGGSEGGRAGGVGEAADLALGLIGGHLETSGVFLDFDGTISHLVSEPELAVPLEGAGQVLDRLSTKLARVGIISGRPVADLRERIFVDGVVYSGLYGFERATGSGPVSVLSDADEWRRVLETVAEDAREFVVSVAGASVETKGLSVTLHYRNTDDPASARGEILAWSQAYARRAQLAVIEGKMNVEILPPVESDKGRAVSELLDGLDRAIYIGDDIGDLPAFRALESWSGQSVAVAVDGAELPSELLEAADVTVDGPVGVLTLLEAVSHAD